MVWSEIFQNQYSSSSIISYQHHKVEVHFNLKKFLWLNVLLIKQDTQTSLLITSFELNPALDCDQDNGNVVESVQSLFFALFLY